MPPLGFVRPALVLALGLGGGAAYAAPAPPEPAAPESAPADSRPAAPAGPATAPSPTSAPSPASALAPPAAPATPAAPAAESRSVLDRLIGGFDFGSYGRILAATDLRGHPGRPYELVSHRPRADEKTYLELDLWYRTAPATVHVTLAFADALFHFDGDFAVKAALRNLYVEAPHLGGLAGLTAWVGSRMLRGDDIYLLDFWPLDDLNTLGGGLALRLGPDDAPFELQLHAGLNRLDDAWQLQTLAAPGTGFVPEDVVYLDRARFIASARATYERRLAGDLRAKVRVYGEAHRIGAGEALTDPAAGTTEPLPADQGWLGGVEVGAWGFGARQGFVNVFLRAASGLAAYGELSVPYGLNVDRRAARAAEWLAGLSANYDLGAAALTVGAYWRLFHDADPNVFDRDDLREGAFVARLTLQLFARAQLLLQASWEGVATTDLSAATGARDHPAAWRFAVMPAWSPFGRGAFTRPHLRILYAVALPNADARALLNPLDPRASERAIHFFGVGAEWWFNSSFR
ncbi:MAG TPA: carbohydrate porin [Myxococcota bacterium]|nr:carbohydrate porin [Myxococcota bacterium]